MKFLVAVVVAGIVAIWALWIAVDWVSKAGDRIVTEVRAPAVEVVAARIHHESGRRYARLKGLVRNAGSRDIAGMQVLATFYDRTGGFVDYETGIVERAILGPGEETPFEVMVRWRPEISRYSIEFKSGWRSLPMKEGGEGAPKTRP